MIERILIPTGLLLGLVVFLYLLFRTLLPHITRKRVERLGSRASDPLLVLRTPWLEAYFVAHVGLILFGLLFPLAVYLGLLGVAWLAVVVVVALTNDAISYSCEARSLSVYVKEIVFRDGIAGQNPRRILLSEITHVKVYDASETGYRLGLEAIEIAGRNEADHPIRLRRIRSAARAEQLIEKLKG